ncbi:MAG: NAD(P)/FAD-dependent oxidoreductase [Planctomycetota bacterium]|nr:MAG: NAD(P)/FAD-dependent oxidoreductase [Planctomycetota bacterium]
MARNRKRVKSTKVAIIGAGPGGISAAIQLYRFQIPFFLFEKDKIGGLINEASLVENYPGMPAISAFELVESWKAHLNHFGIEVYPEEVLETAWKEDHFSILTNKGEYVSEFLIVASGSEHVSHPLLESADPALKEFLFYQTAKIRNQSNQVFAILGAGDIGVDYALSLSRKNKVHLLYRGERIKALPALRERIASHSITLWPCSSIQKIEKGRRKALEISLIQKEMEIPLEVDGLIAAIGRKAAKSFYTQELYVQEKELIQKGRLYLVGDVHNGIYRQSSIAVGEGVKGAMKIYHLLKDCSHLEVSHTME